MIKNLKIKNFKSIKSVELACRKVNIFIGKPNTGKSNILESIGVFSIPFGNLRDFVRFENMNNLFYDEDLEKKIEVRAGNYECMIYFENDSFLGHESLISQHLPAYSFDFNYDYTGKGTCSHSIDFKSPFKFYKFSILKEFPKKDSTFLLPPHGQNLQTILLTNKELRKVVANIFSEYELRIVLKPQDNRIEVQKEVDDVIVSYPYSTVSDTLQRIVFYMAAIDTNKDSVIILEEPEAHSFPYYTKFLAERIALDKTNQYFIATHNPYFLLSVIEKMPKDKIKIFITYFEDYQTKVKAVAEDKLSEILDLDSSIFFNLDRFLEGK